MNKSRHERIFLAGHRGMVGQAVLERLRGMPVDVLTVPRTELDLTDQAASRAFLQREKPSTVIIAAARVGGIMANSMYPAEFVRDNLSIALNLIHESFGAGVSTVLFLGSSCIYPKQAPQPIREDDLLTGPLESTNEAYAVAKIAGLKLCEYYRRQYGVDYYALMPCNLYGPGDNYDVNNSHVLPALIRRFHEARESRAAAVTLWGTGRPRREFLHTEDLARAVTHCLDQTPEAALLNVGSGEEVTIAELARRVAEVVGYQGEIHFDLSKPDGTMRKLMDSSRIRKSGWNPRISLQEGLTRTYADFLRETRAGTRREK
ncbi:MAG: GDP-L-fucose synthase [Lentisphaeria bacterium]|nr:GDP-L-fucose synthase [Lentisphaeria bacterium]